MTDIKPAKCNRCGMSLNNGTPDGLCVRCLLTGALTPPEEEIEAAAELDSPATLLARRQFAGYELLGEIARGGMGVVFRARQKKPGRVIALKVIAAGELATPRMVERFRTEAQAAARLDHPNIVPIYEVGHHGGWHFFSMRLIEGCTLAEKLRGHGLPPEEAARLMGKIARAVQHAHERGVLHRDLKPNNILIDARGEPHLTDFGLAKMMEGSVEMTMSNAVLGTPAYMAPEQAAGGTRDVTVSVDVYGLGAVFYEMLTGRPPFEAPNTHALLRKVAEEEPMPPWERRRLAGPNGVDELAGKMPALPADLDAICLKCLEKEPALRYPSAAQLADDLERALRSEPILAQPSTATQRVRKWVRRNPAKVALAVSIVSLLVIGTVVSTWQAVRATRAERAQSALRRSAEANSYAADINLAQQNLTANNLGRARDLLLRHQPKPGETDLRGWEWRYLWQQAQSDAEFEFTNVSHSITSLSISPDGNLLAVGQTDGGGLAVFDRQTRGEVLRVESKLQRVMTAFSPHESLLAFSFTTGTSSAERRFMVRLWNAATREVVCDISLPSRCERLQFSGDGLTLFASLAAPGQLTLWRVADGQPIAAWPSDSDFSTQVHATDDLSLAAEALSAGKLRLADLRTGRTIWSVQAANEYVTAVAISPDRKVIASAAGFAETDIRLWAADSGREIGRLNGHAGYVHHLSFLPDGKSLLSSSSDQTLRLWDVAEQKPLGVLRGHRQEVWCHALLPDQRTLLSGAKDGSVLVWNVESAQLARGRITLPAPARGWTFAPGGPSVLLGETAGVVSEWPGPDFQQRRVLHDFRTNITRACFTEDGSRIAVELPGRRAVVWDLRSSRVVADFALPAGRSYVEDFSWDGNRLYLDNYQGEDFYEWNVASNQLAQSWRVPGPYDIGAVQSSDDRWRIALNVGGAGVVRDLVAQTNRSFTIQIKEPDAAALSPDHRLLAVTSLRGYVRLYEWPSLREAGTLQGFLQGAHSVLFSPDGRRVAAGSNGREAIKLWDVATQRELITLEGSGSIFSRLRFSPDGTMIGARSSAGLVHLWRAPALIP